MLDGKLSDQDKVVLEEIREIIEKRKSTYGKCRVLSALVKADIAWRNVMTWFQFLYSGETSSSNLSLNYQSFLVKESCISIQQFFDVLDHLVNEGKLSISGYPEVEVQGNLQRDISISRFHSSNDPFLRGWLAY
jgi:hypothetical protein